MEALRGCPQRRYNRHRYANKNNEKALRCALKGKTRLARLLSCRLNGRDRSDAVADNILLLDYLREKVGLTLAATVQGKRVDTIESLGHDGQLSAVQRGFHEKLGSQCGYCTPGFIMASAGLLRRNPDPSDDEILEALGSNICRCTGYVKIIEAVQYAADLHAQGVSP